MCTHVCIHASMHSTDCRHFDVLSKKMFQPYLSHLFVTLCLGPVSDFFHCTLMSQLLCYSIWFYNPFCASWRALLAKSQQVVSAHPLPPDTSDTTFGSGLLPSPTAGKAWDHLLPHGPRLGADEELAPRHEDLFICYAIQSPTQSRCGNRTEA